MSKINKKVLIVEDDKDFLLILQTKFTSEGFLVFVAENGEKGIEMAESEKPDLIFSDILMPKMDGLEMAEKVRKLNSNVKIIFLTNIKADAETEDILKKDNFEYLIKSELRINDIVKKAKDKLNEG